MILCEITEFDVCFLLFNNVEKSLFLAPCTQTELT